MIPITKDDINIGTFCQFIKKNKLTDEEELKIIRLEENDLKSNFFWNMVAANKILSIPLNFDWFAWLGFEADQEVERSFAIYTGPAEARVKKISITYEQDEERIMITKVNGSFITSIRRKQFAHQLQQLSYALTGEALVCNKKF